MDLFEVDSSCLSICLSVDGEMFPVVLYVQRVFGFPYSCGEYLLDIFSHADNAATLQGGCVHAFVQRWQIADTDGQQIPRQNRLS